MACLKQGFPSSRRREALPAPLGPSCPGAAWTPGLRSRKSRWVLCLLSRVPEDGPRPGPGVAPHEMASSPREGGRWPRRWLPNELWSNGNKVCFS